MVKPLTFAELEILAAGPPAHRPHDERGWKAERNKYDRHSARRRPACHAQANTAAGQAPARSPSRLPQYLSSLARAAASHASAAYAARAHHDHGCVGRPGPSAPACQAPRTARAGPPLSTRAAAQHHHLGHQQHPCLASSATTKVLLSWSRPWRTAVVRRRQPRRPARRGRQWHRARSDC